jgi:hypothetical protein
MNRWLVGGPGDDLSAGINAVMQKAGIDSLRIRKDAVLANDILLSVSPEWFRPEAPEAHGTWDNARLKTFEAEARDMLKRTFGARVVSAVLHLDEATPHIQAVVVPVMRKRGGEGWRLSSKDMFDPERLTALQQSWEDRLQPHGVGPRQKGRRATHTTLKEFYGSLEAFKAEDPRLNVRVSEPPPKSLLEAPATHRAKVDTWRKAEAKRLRDDLRPLAVEASRGRLYEAERRRTTELRGDLADAAKDLQGTRLALVATDAKLAIAKEQIQRLRATPINAVAATLGYSGQIQPKENAIDLVRRVGEMDYSNAIAWLAQRFSVEAAAAAVRENAITKLEASPLANVATKAEKTKAKLIGQQLDALAAPSYRVTVMINKEDKKIGINIGKQKDKVEKLFTKAEIIGLIPRLTRENARGGNVFITPIDDAVHHVLVDDLSASSLATLKTRGYAPAVTLETSPGNHQAIIKVPVSAGPKEAANEWFKDLNRDLGDQKITGLIHPFRLAGFENRKEKHQAPDGRFPFVHLVEAANRLCSRAVQLVRAYTAKLEEVSAPRRGPR